MVEQDKSMAAMIQNDSEKEWMLPLLELRNELDFRNNTNPEQKLDHHLRDFRRMGGAVQLIKEGQYVPGPYTQQSRANWLRMLLEAQVHVRRNGPPAVRELDLISLDELKEIRRIWVVDKHELEDILPKIYEQATGGVYPEKTLDDNLILKEKEMQKLEAICGKTECTMNSFVNYSVELVSNVPAGKEQILLSNWKKVFNVIFFENKEDAIMRATKRTEKRNSLKKKKRRTRNGNERS